MQISSNTSTGDNLKTFYNQPFSGERAKWEAYNRFLRTAIKVHPDIPTEWKNFLFVIPEQT